MPTSQLIGQAAEIVLSWGGKSCQHLERLSCYIHLSVSQVNDFAPLTWQVKEAHKLVHSHEIYQYRVRPSEGMWVALHLFLVSFSKGGGSLKAKPLSYYR